MEMRHGLVPDSVPLHLLTTRQRMIVEAIDSFARVTLEPCSASYLARRLRLNRSTITEHFVALHRKGWLKSPGSPASLTRRIAVDDWRRV